MYVNCCFFLFHFISNECHFHHLHAFYDLRTPNVFIFFVLFCFSTWRQPPSNWFIVSPFTVLFNILLLLLLLLLQWFFLFFQHHSRLFDSLMLKLATNSLYMSLRFAYRFTRAIIILFLPTIMFSGHTHTHSLTQIYSV